ncbi:MAG: polyprenyl diphosphate synthase [Desulfurococcaceae archaeon]
MNRGFVLRLTNIMLKPVYRLYEKWLWLQIKNGPFPRHIGIIPDGNRRWAYRMGLQPHEGHLFGYEKIKEVLKWIWDLKIKYVTIFAMSTENCLYRSDYERQQLFNLARQGLEELMNMPEIHEYGVRVRVVGRLEYLPQEVRKTAMEIEEATKNNSNYTLVIALCYGGRQDILDAVRRLAIDVQEGRLTPSSISEEIFTKYLSTGDVPDVDLVVRTSGEERISNFLLWHLAYSELYFCEAYWPEFRKIDLWRAIRSYQRRERRFGR